MCQPMIEVAGKRYRMMDMLLHVFFNTLDDETQQRFFREFEVDKHGEHLVPSAPPYPSDEKARDNWHGG